MHCRSVPGDSRPARRRASTDAASTTRGSPRSTRTNRARCSATWAAASDHPRQLPCHITATTERTHEIIRAATDRSPMFTGQDRRRRAALLPERRGQGRQVRRQGLAPDLRRARGAQHPRGLSERHLHQPAVRRAGRIRAHHQGLRAGAHHAAGLRHRIRLLRSARPEVLARDQDAAATCFSRARSTAPRATRKRRRRVSSPASMRRAPRAARRPSSRSAAKATSACSSTTW